ncbi:hypothetical protein [Streptomyces sp. NPDC000878]
MVATSPSEDGRSFFYANSLHRRHRGAVPDPDAVSPRAESSLRAPWFAVSCCPTNVARTLAQLPAHLATADEQGIQLHQYADAEITTTLTGGPGVALRVRTDYPSGGNVTVYGSTARPRPTRGPCRCASRPGRRAPRPTWSTRTEPAVRSTRARRTSPGSEVDAVRVDPSVEPEDGPDGTVVAPGELVERAEVDPSEAAWPYRPLDRATVSAAERAGIVLVPYNSWANRGPSTMRVWLPTTT